jgi:radical SAM-linked protein
MASELLQPTTGSISSAQGDAPMRVKFRVRFRKAGDLRLVSHHDLMHIFERTFRRACLPVPATQGFNPRPRMWFALSLALGIAGLNEVMELELSDPLDAEEVRRRLVAHAPPGIEIVNVCAIDVRASARVCRAWYRLPGPLPCGTSGAGLAFMQQSDCWIERTRPQRRRINLRPFVSELRVSAHGLDMALWISPKGAARPEEVVAALGLKASLDDGAVLERTNLEIIDELPPGTPLNVPALDTAIEETRRDDRDLPEEASASSRPTAIISNPLSFDS